MSEQQDRPELLPDGLTAVFRRLKDHRIAQWTVGYVAVAYGIQHAVTLTSEAFKWPDGVLRVSMLLLVLGLPVAMTLAWYHGERASRRASGAEMAIISILLLIASLGFYAFVRPAGEAVVRVASAQTASLTPAVEGNISASGLAGTTLAVLPFANVSGDAGQEFFSDGMTDEIMTALAKIPTLSVVARESAFTFKGRTQDVRAIGKALGARYLVEGSVRKAEDRVRITAQLVRADTGVSLWTDAYDRELKDVFAVQEDVARAIAASLRAPLGLGKGETLVSNRNIDPDSYQQYLLARSLVRARSMDQAIPILESLFARDPDYAPSSALLAYAKYLMAEFFAPELRTGPVEDARHALQPLVETGEAAARRAIASDPRNAFAFGALASIALIQKKWSESDELFRQALALDPNDPEILQAYSIFLAATGQLRDYLAIGERKRALEPFVPVYNFSYAVGLYLVGRPDGLPALKAVAPDQSFSFVRNILLANISAAAGQYNDAASVLLLSSAPEVGRKSLEDAARLLRAAPNAGPAEKLPQLPGELGFVYLYVGARDRAMEFAERTADIGYVSLNANTWLWTPAFAPLRQTARFKEYLKAIGLLDYWRSGHWGDLCHPVGTSDFACN